MRRSINTKLSKKTVAGILTIAMVLISGGSVLLAPKPAQAQLSTFDPATFGQDLVKNIKDFISEAWNKRKTIYQTASVAASKTFLAWQQSEEWYKQATAVALEIAFRQIMAMVTNDINDWIKSGFDGKPAFMDKNVGDFLAEAGNIAGGNFIDKYLGAGFLCDEFDFDVKLTLLPEITFNESARCTLEDIGVNLKSFYNDFSNGGWEGWVKLVEPKNNYNGALLLAISAKDEEEQKAREELEQDMAMGDGFLSIKDCIWYDAEGTKVIEKKGIRGMIKDPVECFLEPIKTIPTPGGFVMTTNSPGTTKSGHIYPCTKKCVTRTPSSIVNELAKKNVTEPLERMSNSLANLVSESGSIFTPYIISIADTLLNQVTKEGFAALKGDSGPSSSYPSKPLSAGEKLVEISDVPSYVNNDIANAQIMVSNLNETQKKINELLLFEDKTISLFEREEENLTSWPADLIAYLNKLILIIGEFESWGSRCLSKESGHNKTIFKDRTTFPDPDEFSFFSKTYSSWVAYMRRYNKKTETVNMEIEELVPRRVFVSKETITATSSTQEIVTEKLGMAYSFTLDNVIDEGVLVVLDTKETATTTITNTTGTATSTSVVSTESIPKERYYERLDWYVKVDDIDLLEKSSERSAVDHTRQAMNDFINIKIKDRQNELENINSAINEAIYDLENYIVVAEAYLEFHQNNADKINSTNIQGQYKSKELELFEYQNIAINSIQRIGSPDIFTSIDFEGLYDDVSQLAEIVVEESGNLQQVLGEKEYPNEGSLYGLVNNLEYNKDTKVRNIVYFSTLWKMCETGKLQTVTYYPPN